MGRAIPQAVLHLSVTPARSAVRQAVPAAVCLLAGVSMRLVQGEAISSEALCHASDWRRFCFVSMGPDRVEEHFPLADPSRVLLRREVDGQGLTERVRLTPMGR